MDRLRALEIFKTVAVKGSFVKAAELLNLSNPVVTRAVQELEAMLGVRLLQRSTRRMSLTPEGSAVLERAKSLLDAFDELASIGSTSEGEIRLTAPASFGAARLIPVLAKFRATHPKVRVDLVLTDERLDLVEHGIDLALRIARTLPDSLIARRIGEARIGAFSAPEYLRARGMPRHPDELEAHDCLVYGGPGRDSTWRFHHPVTQALVEPALRASFFANSTEALLGAALHGAGLAMLPHFLVESAVAQGRLVPVLAQWPSPALDVYLAYGSARNQPQRVRQLIDHLAAALPPHFGAGPLRNVAPDLDGRTRAADQCSAA
ncbi:HTH-type transcriptional regulator DmlR [Gammaproteobacteria bacterium]|nr:HTH-type transcriptional regulator DmlR [Gammaproteobacteria bacterium]